MVVIENNNVRISLILPTVLRVEVGTWTDMPTQTVLYREFGETEHTIITASDIYTIQTNEALFCVHKSGKVLSITPKGCSKITDLQSGIHPGTARTLDTANGAVKLERGITSKNGVSVLDDSKSLLLAEDGRILPREACEDKYYFACGRDYCKQLQTFFKLTGQVPLIPKYALGNWWSRYKAYTQEEYRSLMQNFIDKKLPITVATIDMDWHWTDVVSRFGEKAKADKPKCFEELIYNLFMHGWTGYTWNTELFPDHKELLSWLHAQGFKVPLNVHPSQGIRFFEEAYEKMCERMGTDPKNKEYIPFDPTDPIFMKAYFEVLHHPLEEEGVDFWWLDWQQGNKTKTAGLDPLWALNHYHTHDSGKNGRRPLILSRYAGMGSHRYPLGFSGDTICTWKSLDFQPYFTNCASNAGYTWWSHDIGGHMHGVQDDELYLRWLQYGVFSPINRLHSSNSEFMGKEPWKRSWAVEKISEDFLRLRHKLIPYLYSVNYQTHKYGTPLCSPMYYSYDCNDAYNTKNQYMFGTQLLVSPITEPSDKRLNLAKTKAWLPEGRWTDIFNGRIYQGGQWVQMYRDLDSIPVLAKEGAIVPMYRSAENNDLSLEQPLEIHIWRGNGSFELYEDDGETMEYENGRYLLTKFEVEELEGTLRFTITPPKDNKGLLSQERQMYLCFRDIKQEDICVTVSDKPVVVELKDVRVLENPSIEELQSSLLTRIQSGNDWKNRHLKKNYPSFIKDVLAELNALWIKK